jgi:glycosyltransferase involved in cell wall biosynthesis
MRICLILEGSYPYTFGGVSSWTHNYIKAMPHHEFILWVIGAKASDKGKFKYELPENVKEVHEVFLDDALLIKPNKKDKFKLSDVEKETLKAFIDCNKPDWNVLFEMFQVKRYNPASFLMSDDFLDTLTELCKEKYPYIAFADIFYTIRSMLIPVLHILQSEVPKANIYHTVCTGYGGLLAALANYVTGKKVILTEHGIYSREREEEIIRARWVVPEFKKHWIRFFYMLSDAIYGRAENITCLFQNASKIQIELGAPPERCKVIPNGIHYDKFCDIPLKEEDGIVDIAAVIRLAPIKDVKTLIYSFNELKSMRKNVRLHILGGTDDEEYAKECYDLVKTLGLSDVLFVGQVNVIEYMTKIDFTILTSISEGQPLSVLESFAARRPAVTTDVGCCRALIEGEEGDLFGQAGYCVPPMHREALALAMDKMCNSRQQREEMGNAGQKRVEKCFKHGDMIKKYASLYRY